MITHACSCSTYHKGLLVDKLRHRQRKLSQVHLKSRTAWRMFTTRNELHVSFEVTRKTIRSRAALVGEGPRILHATAVAAANGRFQNWKHSYHTFSVYILRVSLLMVGVLTFRLIYAPVPRGQLAVLRRDIGVVFRVSRWKHAQANRIGPEEGSMWGIRLLWDICWCRNHLYVASNTPRSTKILLRSR